MATRKKLKQIEKLLFVRETERQNWATLIGRFMMAFGDIESVTLRARADQLMQQRKERRRWAARARRTENVSS
jgi:hypothetical protein